MVRRFLYSLAFIFFCSSGYCLNGPDGETLVPTLNPFTGNLQLITEISTNTIIPGTGITITTAPGSITINTNGGGGDFQFSSNSYFYYTGTQVCLTVGGVLQECWPPTIVVSTDLLLEDGSYVLLESMDKLILE